MAWDKNLYGQAKKIAAADESPLLVVAGPGTGKSFALKRRVARLLEQGADPKRILAVTFTRNAASNLIEDLKSIGVNGCDQIRIGTLHSFCYSILMKQDVLAILDRYPRPIIFFNKSGVMQFEGAPLLNDILEETRYGNKREATKAIRAFEAAWAKLQNEEPGWAISKKDRKFHDVLIDWLKFHKAILIGELIPITLQYLRDNPASQERHAFDHILVDEFQDLNKAEQVLLDLLAERSKCFIVGDPDQSIYSFRYAHPEGIITFGETHQNTYEETLVDCRRCPQLVVELADCLIKNNYSPDEPSRLKPFADNPEGKIAIVQWQNLEDEAVGIAKLSKYLIDDLEYSPKDILILSPRRLIAYKIRDLLRESNIEVHSFYYEEALETEEAQKNFCLLTLLCNNDDRVALRYWLGLGSPSWNIRGYKKIRNYCQKEGKSPFEVMQLLCSNQINLPYTNPLVRQFKELQDRLEVLGELTGLDLFDELFPQDQDWGRPMREIVKLKLTEETSAQELLDLLKTQITQPKMPEEGDFIRIMSLHKSKGLSSKVVIVVGCVEGLCPIHDPDLTQEEKNASLKEQRRLFYVAITRCREILVLSSVARIEKRIAHKIGANTRGRGHYAQAITSRFINELGPKAPRPIDGSDWMAHGFKM